MISSHQPFTPDDVLQIFDRFIYLGSQILLHLKFLREVRLYVWNADQTAPEELYSMALDGARMKPDGVAKRSSLFLTLASKLEQCKAKVIEKDSVFESMLASTPAKEFPQDVYDIYCRVKGTRRAASSTPSSGTTYPPRFWASPALR